MTLVTRSVQRLARREAAKASKNARANVALFNTAAKQAPALLKNAQPARAGVALPSRVLEGESSFLFFFAGADLVLEGIGDRQLAKKDWGWSPGN